MQAVGRAMVTAVAAEKVLEATVVGAGVIWVGWRAALPQTPSLPDPTQGGVHHPTRSCLDLTLLMRHQPTQDPRALRPLRGSAWALLCLL